MDPEIVFAVATALKVSARRLVTEFCRAAKAKGGCSVDNKVGNSDARAFAGYPGVVTFVLHRMAVLEEGESLVTRGGLDPSLQSAFAMVIDCVYGCRRRRLLEHILISTEEHERGIHLNAPCIGHHPHSPVLNFKPSIAAEANFTADLTVIGSEDRIFGVNYKLREFRNNEGKIPSSMRHRELRVAS